MRQGTVRVGDQAIDARLQRAALTLSTGLMAVMALLWGLLYLYYDEPLAAAIPLGYALFSLASFWFLRRGGIAILRTSQLLVSLVLPFLLMWALGGFVGSSGVVLWSLTSPMGALIFAGRRQAIGWFGAFVVLVVVSAFVGYPAVRPANNLPDFVIVWFFVLNFVGLSTVAFVLTAYFVGKTNESLLLLDAEREKSDGLIRNMLPLAISERLKADQHPIADGLQGVSVLFVDIVNFTSFAMRRDPAVVVSLLNELFGRFDELAERHGLEKIKTIGDAYLVCGGLAGDAQAGAEAIANFALDVGDLLQKLRAERGHDVSLRMGMHVGPVVAGVIGKRKYSYDIWGNTVNVAARLQSVCEPGHILVSADLANLLAERFAFGAEGETELRGHTPVPAYDLVGLGFDWWHSFCC